ncbi:hypothetical protein COCCADRAFT_98423, partial [Bipolaris zeicola 26-R-13]
LDLGRAKACHLSLETASRSPQSHRRHVAWAFRRLCAPQCTAIARSPGCC